MRLAKIKIAGFKSFVDARTLKLEGNLTAVVGPNGCGKSNVIDAVRWVMGERSAKQLRAGIKTDVIFNGAKHRHPVGKASVELIFDNSQGQLGGKYASYSEIAVRRTLNREGLSIFFLNGTRCRRKDIVDLFLGTGLGPRSYAIIEQGMISKLIEAHPTELRVFLEEAAGISKYRERRRETEQRLGHTWENLQRLNDVRTELDKQVQKLNSQAKTAKKYKILKQDEKRLHLELLALRWREHEQAAVQQQGLITTCELELAAIQSAKTSRESTATELKVTCDETRDNFNRKQAGFYQNAAEIAKIEQEINHIQNRKAQINKDLTQINKEYCQHEQQGQADTQQLKKLTTRQQVLEPKTEALAEQNELCQAQLQKAEQQWDKWQSHWHQQQTKSHDNKSAFEVSKVRLQQAQQSALQTQQRVDQLKEQLKTQQQAHDNKDWQNKNKQVNKLIVTELEALKQLEKTQHTLTNEITQLNTSKIFEQQQADEQKENFLTIKSRLSALKADDHQQPNQQQKDRAQLWHNLPKLSQQLRVQPGWELALEIALGEFVKARLIPNFKQVLREFEPENHLDLVLIADQQAPNGAATGADNASNSKHPATLLSKLLPDSYLPKAVHHLLAKVHTVETYEEALTYLPQLSKEQVLLTKDGLCIGPGFVKITNSTPAGQGQLQRAALVRTLSETLPQAEQQMNSKITHLQQLAAQLQDQRQSLSQSKQRSMASKEQLLALKAQRSECLLQIDQHEKHNKHISAEIVTLSQNLVQISQQETTLGEKAGLFESQAEKDQQLELNHLAEKGTLQHLREQAKQEFAANQKALRLLELECRTVQTEIAAIAQQNERMLAQQFTLNEKKQKLKQEISQQSQPITNLQSKLQQHIEQRLQIETEQKQLGEQVADIEVKLRQMQGQLLEIEQQAGIVTARIQQNRIEWQGWEVRKDEIRAQLASSKATVEQVLDNIDPVVNLKLLEQRLAQTQQKIKRLGAINLAAIEEFGNINQRKTYLDEQCQDLTKALTTLEKAIVKIDNETKSRFKETFDRVDQELRRLFPRVFGGGHAYLEMTENDLLNTGVTIMARPPGKRNTTIQMLSGGEKALTAIALVFAFFKLTPAPFCMLDEVDAPLDDANVGRFCRLVTEMSENLQFIYISHNKLAMEMAQHLIGVTMSEPGVSDLVSVHLDEALQYAVTA